MYPSFSKLLLITFLLAACSGPKNISKTDTQTANNLKAHIQYLADDKLEGRRTGTHGEELAMQYIISQFKEIGLTPKGTEYYPQSFIVNDGKQINDVSELIINGDKLETKKDYFPFPFCPDQKIEALPSVALQEVGMPWFFDLKETLEANKDNPHFDLVDYIHNNFKGINDRGAVAMIFYNSSDIDDKLAFDPKDKSEKLAIPAVYVSKEAAKKYFSDKSATLNIKLRTLISEKNRLGHNVIGYIDNDAETTVILGAHYDHLGYGEDGNSRNTSKEPAIHNGADDNASGTAALIELARKLKSSNATNNNYLFIAFSGEELGLFGSKYFTEHPTIDLNTVNYMINMDMVGRLNDSTKVLTIGGYGTSPEWSAVISKDYFDPPNNAKKTAPSLTIKFDSSGTGPSDHTSFYRKDIPVLFYFTGLHTDYHKPSDDADKINYSGEQVVVQHVYSVIESLNDKPKLAFTKTRETQTTTSARFSVSLGIMPDYTFAGTGVRADGVSDGKPAQKAGLQTGDIIIQLGDNNISSLENYMQALGKFKKGEKTKVKFKRGNEIKEAVVEF
ncbi:MAG TPA: M20/M25/M40 family metallo-hydrolase [Chitinophagaceae bacterium]|nr:M20/M25/M40 family metallo-hydrolase [Chitinophagaceae bacterium]